MSDGLLHGYRQGTYVTLCGQKVPDGSPPRTDEERLHLRRAPAVTLHDEWITCPACGRVLASLEGP